MVTFFAQTVAPLRVLSLSRWLGEPLLPSFITGNLAGLVPVAAITRRHLTEGLASRSVLSPGSEGLKSETKVSAGLVYFEGREGGSPSGLCPWLVDGCLLSAASHLSSVRVYVQISSSYNTHIPLGEAHTNDLILT